MPPFSMSTKMTVAYFIASLLFLFAIFVMFFPHLTLNLTREPFAQDNEPSNLSSIQYYRNALGSLCNFETSMNKYNQLISDKEKPLKMNRCYKFENQTINQLHGKYGTLYKPDDIQSITTILKKQHIVPGTEKYSHGNLQWNSISSSSYTVNFMMYVDSFDRVINQVTNIVEAFATATNNPKISGPVYALLFQVPDIKDDNTVRYIQAYQNDQSLDPNFGAASPIDYFPPFQRNMDKKQSDIAGKIFYTVYVIFDNYQLNSISKTIEVLNNKFTTFSMTVKKSLDRNNVSVTTQCFIAGIGEPSSNPFYIGGCASSSDSKNTNNEFPSMPSGQRCLRPSFDTTDQSAAWSYGILYTIHNSTIEDQFTAVSKNGIFNCDSILNPTFLVGKGADGRTYYKDPQNMEADWQLTDITDTDYDYDVIKSDAEKIKIAISKNSIGKPDGMLYTSPLNENTDRWTRLNVNNDKTLISISKLTDAYIGIAEDYSIWLRQDMTNSAWINRNLPNTNKMIKILEIPGNLVVGINAEGELFSLGNSNNTLIPSTLKMKNIRIYTP